jgi:hypothetical protein
MYTPTLLFGSSCHLRTNIFRINRNVNTCAIGAIEVTSIKFETSEKKLRKVKSTGAKPVNHDAAGDVRMDCLLESLARAKTHGTQIASTVTIAVSKLISTIAIGVA